MWSGNRTRREGGRRDRVLRMDVAPVSTHARVVPFRSCRDFWSVKMCLERVS